MLAVAASIPGPRGLASQLLMAVPGPHSEARWNIAATEAVIAEAETAGSEPDARVERLTRVASGGFDVELELALRDWGRRDPAAASVLDDVDRRRMGYLRQLLRESGFDAAETEARAFLMYSALLGEHLLPESHGRFSRKRVLRTAFELLAFSSPTDRNPGQAPRPRRPIGS